MTSRFRKGILGLLLVVLLTAHNGSADSPYVKIRNDKYRISMEIKYAFYTDADHDGYKDDIKAYIDVHTCTWREEFSLSVHYQISLITAKGHSFTHNFDKTISDDSISYVLILYNQALERGYYDLYVTIHTSDGGNMQGTAWLTFDPPGGGGGDPMAVMY